VNKHVQQGYTSNQQDKEVGSKTLQVRDMYKLMKVERDEELGMQISWQTKPTQFLTDLAFFSPDLSLHQARSLPL
jgi:hypothetical protein